MSFKGGHSLFAMALVRSYTRPSISFPVSNLASVSVSLFLGPKKSSPNFVMWLALYKNISNKYFLYHTKILHKMDGLSHLPEMI